jgi:hypothetical protein
MRAVATGAQRGVGLELVRLVVGGDTVGATCGHPEQASTPRDPVVRMPPCDLGSVRGGRPFVRAVYPADAVRASGRKGGREPW